MIDRIIVPLFIFAYGFLFFHLALGLFFIKGRRKVHDIALCLTFDYSVMSLVGSYTVYNGLASKPLNLVVFASLVAIAPIGLDLFIELFSVREAWRRTLIAVITTTVAVIAVAAILFFKGIRPNLIYAFGYGWLLIALSAFFLREGKNLLPLSTMPSSLKILYILLALDVLFIFGLFLAQLTGFVNLCSPLWFLVSVSQIAKITRIVKRPDTLRDIEREISERREIRSRIANIDERRLSESLERLMSDERAFLDPDIRLADLSEKLGITSHQLSEFINTRFSRTFNQYVNQYRVAYACSSLEADNARPIIEIAYASGFNSKSAFNTAFKSHTGMTPSDYARNAASRGKMGGKAF